MQTEVPTLPVVHLNANKNFNRKQNLDLRSSTVEAKTCSPYKSVAILSSNKTCLHPLLGGPYRSNVRRQPQSDQSKVNKNSAGQRVLSAKMLRVKELQNQLADAHYHLNELANENRLLKALQKRQDSALKRYEGTNAELPRIIHSHHEELRVLQIKYKKLRAIHKETCESLKEKESELQCLQSQNKHLLQLSKDRNLGEREKLQIHVSDLNHRIEQQQETIQALHKKLTLESKSLKHQLHMEISKRKETQRNLDETIGKLKELENLLDNRERRLYCNGQLSVRNKNERLGTQSLTNLRDMSTSHPLKLSNRDKKWEKDIQKKSLPILNTSVDNEDKGDTKRSLNEATVAVKTETMSNFQQIRRYRLQKSLRTHRSSLSDDLEEESKESDIKLTGNSPTSVQFENSENRNKSHEKGIVNQYELEGDEFRRIFQNKNYQHDNKLLTELETELDYSSKDTDSENENKKFEDRCQGNVAQTSRELHARLINSTDDASDTTEDFLRKTGLQYHDEKLSNDLEEKELIFSNHKYKSKLKVSRQVDEKQDSDESDRELNCEVTKKLNVTQLNKKVTSKSTSSNYNAENYLKFNEEIEEATNAYTPQVPKDTNYKFSNGSQICQNLINEMQVENNLLLRDKHFHNFQSTVNSKRHHSTIQNEINHLWYNMDDEEQVLPASTMYQSLQDSKEYVFNDGVLLKQESIEKSSKNTEYENIPMGDVKYPVEEYQHLEGSFKVFKTVKDSAFPVPDMLLSKDEHPLNYCEREEANSVETRNKLNKAETSVESENISTISKAAQDGSYEEHRETSIEVKNVHELNNKEKTSTYNKEILLATMKAIDDNENIEFLSNEYSKHGGMSRKQITENLFRGLPTQTKTKQDIIKDIFKTDNTENKSKSSYSKLH